MSDERGYDTKGSRKALGAINAKLKAKVGRLEREVVELKAEIEQLKERLSNRAAEHCDDLAEKVGIEIQRDKLAKLLEMSLAASWNDEKAFYEACAIALAEVNK